MTDTNATRRQPIARQVGIAVSMLVALLLAPAGARSDTIEIHDFQADLPRYVGQQVTVEGRFRSAGAGRLSLVDSEIEFQLTDRAGQVRRSMRGIEIDGQLVRAAPRPVFRVERFRSLPADVERFRERRERISPGNYRALFELAQGARQRAAWYRDRPLGGLAAEAYRTAFDWNADEAIRLHDAERLLWMAAWGELAGLAPDRATELRHEACLAIVGRVSATDATGRHATAERVGRLLAGTERPLTTDQRESAAAYLDDPAGVYPKLAPAERRIAHRALWSGLIAAAIEQLASANDADLDALAARAAQEVPDRPDTVRRLRIAALTAHAADAPSLSRAEVLRLRADLAELGQSEAGDQAVERWLAAQRERLATNDAEGRLLLAAEYTSLLNDRRTASELLIDALRIAPDLAEAETALTELGYARRAGVWQPTSDAGPQPDVSPAETADRPLASGDSEETVLARLRRPDRVARVGTRNDISEQWIYDGPPRLSIYLRRSSVTGRAFVTRIDSGP